MAWKLRIFFIFPVKFDLACTKVEALEGFWYQGIGVSPSKLTTPRYAYIKCLCYCPFSLNFPAVPPPKIRACLEKKKFLDSFVERAIKFVNFIFLRRT